MRYIGWIFTILMLGSCVSTPVSHVSYDHQADFSKYKTFAWLPSKTDCPEEGESASAKLYESQIVGNKIKELVTQELKEKGLKPDTQSPDVVLQYDIIMENKERIVSVPLVANQPNYIVTDPNAFSLNTPYYMYNYLRNDYTISPYSYYYSGINMFNTTPGPNYGYRGYLYTPYVVGNYFEKINYQQGTLLIDVIDAKSNSLIWRGWSQEALLNASQFESNLPGEIDQIMAKYPIPELGMKPY